MGLGQAGECLAVGRAGTVLDSADLARPQAGDIGVP